MALKLKRSTIPDTIGSGIPVRKTQAAKRFFDRLPQKGTAKVFGALDDWLKGIRLSEVRVGVICEPEDPSWCELVMDLQVEADDESGLALWDEMGAVLDKAMEGLPEGDVAKLNECLAVHLLWGKDSWDVDSADAV